MFACPEQRVSSAPGNPVKGFSLIELMVVIAIVAVLAMLAVPGLSAWVDGARAKSVRQQIYGMATEARSTALKESRTVTLCHLEQGQCQPGFNFPVSSFTDENGNDELDGDDQVLRVLTIKLPEKIRLSWNDSTPMSFLPSGRARGGSLSYCDGTRPDKDFRIVVSLVGRLRIDESDTRCNQTSATP